MSHDMLLHFSLGPVQGFIRSARRIRDYWAGSFLLGYLSGIAMRAVVEGWPFREDGGAHDPYGEIDFPDLSGDKFYKALSRQDRNSIEYIATLPNRFRARIGRAEDFSRNRPCEQAVGTAWKKIADAVWYQFLDSIPVSERPRTRAIWDRQIAHFFEMTWAMAPEAGDGSDGDWLDRRKNWRTHSRDPEDGDHCRIMGDYQELSGWVRAQERAQQDRFWELVQEQVRKTLYQDDALDRDYDLLELRNTERLCAIALVKRLFPVLPVATLREVLGWIPNGLATHDKKDQPRKLRFWPSTAYMAAVPWIMDAWTLGDNGEGKAVCDEFTETCRTRLHVEAVAERESRVPSLRKPDNWSFGMLDGSLFFEDALKTEIEAGKRNIKSLSKTSPATDDSVERERWRNLAFQDVLDALKKLIGKLKELRPQAQTHRQRRFERSPEFYALLLMDGDHGGALMRPDRLGSRKVSAGFARFQERVPEIVAEHDGVLIYGGADDVKALLPLDRAIDCAIALRGHYLRAFADIFADDFEKLRANPATISAGLVFAHYHVPLASVIEEAHDILDRVAKEENGRNSIAISVWKPSGKAADYVTAFAGERHGETAKGPIDHLVALAGSYARDAVRSSSFIYNLRARFADVLMPDAGAPLLAPESEEVRRLLIAQWTKGREEEAAAGANEAVEELLKVCLAIRNEPPGRTFRLHGALIAKFLADNGVGATAVEPA